MVLVAVAGEIEEQDVLAPIHAFADAGQCAFEVGDGGQRNFGGTAGVVHQAQGAAFGIQPAGGECGQEIHLVAECAFVGIAAESEHVHVDVMGALRCQCVERGIEQRGLGVEGGFGGGKFG